MSKVPDCSAWRRVPACSVAALLLALVWAASASPAGAVTVSVSPADTTVKIVEPFTLRIAGPTPVRPASWGRIRTLYR